MLWVIINSQLANFWGAKQMLLVADNVINTYNYSNLLTAIRKHSPVFVVKVSRPYFSTRPQGMRAKNWMSGDETSPVQSTSVLETPHFQSETPRICCEKLISGDKPQEKLVPRYMGAHSHM